MNKPSLLEIVTRHTIDGSIQIYLDNGFVSWKTLLHRDIYWHYDILRKRGVRKMDAQYQTADEFKVGLSTVRRAIEAFEK